MKYFALLTCFVSQLTMASSVTDSTWNNILTQNAITNFSDQAYCFTSSKGEVEGKNIDLRVRLASVSKLITSLWAVEKLGVNYQYQTKLYIKDKNLHIAGSFDPFFGNEKVFYLLSQLNELGYKEFDTITFDKDLIIFPSAQTHTDIYPNITPAFVSKNLNNYFNTKAWSKIFKAEYNRIANLSKNGKFLDQVDLSVNHVQFSESNPFENDPEARVLTYTSPALAKYLKEINVQSNNYAAHTIFLQLGGETSFSKFVSDSFNLEDKDMHFYTGSGLPTTINGIRKDNYGTCSVVLKLIEELRLSTEKQNMKIEDVIAVPGSDKGTFRNRVFSSELKNSFVAKTGTLTNVSTLAGMMSTKNGYSAFGVFNQTPKLLGAKKSQNTIVEAILEDLGGPLAFDYTADIFHTYNRDENIKNNNLDESAISEFMPFEEALTITK